MQIHDHAHCHRDVRDLHANHRRDVARFPNHRDRHDHHDVHVHRDDYDVCDRLRTHYYAILLDDGDDDDYNDDDHHNALNQFFIKKILKI